MLAESMETRNKCSFGCIMQLGDNIIVGWIIESKTRVKLLVELHNM